MNKVCFLAGAVLAFADATGLCAQALANKPRLTRPASHSTDGKLYADSTVGNLVVETIGDMHRKIQAVKNPATAQILAEQLYCKSTGTSEIIAVMVKEKLKKTTKADRALLRGGDSIGNRRFAMATVAYLDNVNEQSIADDEAIGPGVYNGPIAGMEQALQTCRFYGHLR